MSKIQVKKAVLPVAGLGTRFLTASKVVPKELFPIVDKPILEIIIEELIDAGIEKLLLIIRRGKEIISQHFDINFELEQNLRNAKKIDFLKKIESTNIADKIVFQKQSEPLGFADAISLANNFVCGEPFVLCTGDELVINDKKSCIKQLIDIFEEKNSTIVGLSQTPLDELCNYGVVDFEKWGNVVKIKNIVEKPKGNPPSNLALNGKYVVKSEIFNFINSCKLKSAGKEVLFTDCLFELAKQNKMYGYVVDGQRYDTGDKFGFIKANIEFGLKDKIVGEKLKRYLKGIKDEL